jgi:hypothetical protein
MLAYSSPEISAMGRTTITEIAQIEIKLGTDEAIAAGG